MQAGSQSSSFYRIYQRVNGLQAQQHHPGHARGYQVSPTWALGLEIIMRAFYFLRKNIVNKIILKWNVDSKR